jgi:hypothetical protein
MRSGGLRKFGFVMAALLVVAGVFQSNFYQTPAARAYTPTHVAGQDYNICDLASTYLTSPWTYHALASGSQQYTVAQYEALTGYGTTLPPLPAYVAAESSSTTAAVIFAPGSPAVSSPAYDFPETPLLYFFEGGSYGALGLDTVSGDEFIGGSTTGFPEPTFDNGNGAGGINGQNGSHYFSGGSSTLASAVSSGATSITTVAAIPGYIANITFSDGSTYQISSVAGTAINLTSPLTSNESAGSAVWANRDQPISEVTSSAAQGTGTVTLTASSIPLVQYGSIMIGDHNYQITSVAGTQSGYTIGVGSLDMAVATGTPIYYADLSGGVTVSYLNIAHDSHNTTGTIYTGAGWTVTHNNIHDGYKDQTTGSPTPGLGVAIYGGDQGTIEYNCLDKMGDYGVNIFGTNNKFDYNEVRDSNYEPDPGCGCSGGGKWWGTMNADIVDNAWINDSPGAGVPIWLDNGNTGTLISGNYFEKSYGSAVHSETGYNLNVTGNLFEDGGWGNGTGGCGDNCDGAVNLNSSGGWNVPGSRYNNQVTVSGNQFVNNWSGISIWQAGGRTCENSGEGWPNDAGYCSGGFPNSAAPAASGQYYFSHTGDTAHGFTTAVVQGASGGSSTVLVEGALAINDQIGFANPAATTTTSTTNVTSFSGTGTISATTTGFPSSGQLRVGTSSAWGDGNGSWTGAVLSYTGTTGSSFTGVSFVRGSGTLAGPIQQVQPYKVTSEACYANDCAVTITPSLTSNVATGATVTNTGTCQLYATAAALPSGPLAPNGTSYWDGCQWEAQRIAISGNTFMVQPSQINASTPINGGGTVGTHKDTGTGTFGCNPTLSCGSNFMADQYNSGEAPFVTEIGSNAMLSNSALTGCPSWDSGCTTNPLANLNAGSNPPGAPAGNGEAAGNDVWSGNTYMGPWAWSTYIYGNCAGGGVFMPADSSTGHSLGSSTCNVDYSGWQADWSQDSGSTYSPIAITLGGLTSGQFIHGPTQGVTAYADSTAGAITSHLQVNGSTVSTLSSSPYNFNLNTLNYADGSYTVGVSGTDSGSHTSSDSLSVYVTNGDLNGDGKVNLSDLAVMAGFWLQTDPNYSHGNITGQSAINLSDLAVMAANWGWSKQ